MPASSKTCIFSTLFQCARRIKHAPQGSKPACIHPARRRGYVSCKCEGGHPPGSRLGLEKVSAAGRLKIRRAPHAETQGSSEFTRQLRYIEPPWRRQLFPAHAVRRGGNHARYVSARTPALRGVDSGSGCLPTTLVTDNHCIPPNRSHAAKFLGSNFVVERGCSGYHPRAGEGFRG